MNKIEWKEYSVTTNLGETHSVTEPVANYIMFLEGQIDRIKDIVNNDKVTGIEAKLMVLDIVGEYGKDNK